MKITLNLRTSSVCEHGIASGHVVQMIVNSVVRPAVEAAETLKDQRLPLKHPRTREVVGYATIEPQCEPPDES